MNKRSGFTIVELLVVIVVIGVLAAISLVSYNGISKRAIEASLQSDLVNASRIMKVFNVENGIYPDTILCSIPDSTTNKCIKTSSGNKFATEVDNTINPKSFYAEASNGSICFSITDNTPPVNTCRTPPPTVTIGSQTWMQNNLNVGTKIDTPTVSSNNGIVEKYCYNNLDSNCTTFGGIYQWDEMMKYSRTPGTQGICPIGFHIPTNEEWITLKNTVPASEILVGGSTGFNMPTNSGGFNVGYYHFITPVYWTSTEQLYLGRYDGRRWSLDHDENGYSLYGTNVEKTYGQSVRCIKN